MQVWFGPSFGVKLIPWIEIQAAKFGSIHDSPPGLRSGQAVSL